MKRLFSYRVIFVAFVLKNNSAPIKCTLILSGLPIRVDIYLGLEKFSWI